MDSFRYAVRSTMFAMKSAVVASTPTDIIRSTLTEFEVPVSEDLCRSCPNPCDEGHGEYPAKYDVDLSSDLLGTFKPYGRQVVISTGKSDWAREVTDDTGTLAAHLSAVDHALLKTVTPPQPTHNPALSSSKLSLIHSADSARLSILNGSHRTTAHEEGRESVIVLPDYKVVEVDGSEAGARQLWQSALDPTLGRVGRNVSDKVKTYTLPYHCVILLCSHKRRDNRCAIAAPRLESEFSKSLSHEGWEVHTEIEHLELAGRPLEELQGTEEEKTAEVLRRLKSLDDEQHKKALLLKCSHTGGHKFAGNAIIYTPHGQGTGVWYGRVSPHEVPAIVRTTIIGGKVLPALLRGGINLSRQGNKSLLSW